jgi:hypothetical protein
MYSYQQSTILPFLYYFHFASIFHLVLVLQFRVKKEKKKKNEPPLSFGQKIKIGKISFNPLKHLFCNHPLKFINSQFSVSNFKKFAMSPFPLGFGVKSNGKWVK